MKKENNIYKLFRQQVEYDGKKQAVIFENKVYTYEEISYLIDELESVIKSTMNKACNIAVLVERSIYSIVCEMAILKAGCTFVPIDIKLPKERIIYMINNANVDLIISYHYEIPEVTCRIIDIENAKSKRDSMECGEAYEHNSLAYILYTSGTTGMPKGVMISNKALYSFIIKFYDKINFKKSQKILGLTSVSFDISIFELIASLCYGFTIVLASDKEYKNPRLLKKLICYYKIDVLQITPSMLSEMLYDKKYGFLDHIKLLLIGGESLSLELLKVLQENKVEQIYNVYGPTEATIWSSVSNITNKNYIDIGTPLDGVQYYINELDTEDSQGELFIAGENLADGYVNLEGITNEKFIQINMNGHLVTVYKTGDIVSRNSSGEMFYMGRNDEQVKINGHRIELSEIEKQIQQYLGISEAYVLQYKQSLIAVIKSSKEFSQNDLTNYLKNILPYYMLPYKYYIVNELPYTISGKIDRKKLLRRITEEKRDEVISTEEDAITDIVLEIISSHIDINIDFMMLDTSLKQLGVDSLTFVRIIVSIEEAFLIEFEVEDMDLDLFDTSRRFVEYVKGKTKDV